MMSLTARGRWLRVRPAAWRACLSHQLGCFGRALYSSRRAGIVTPTRFFCNLNDVFILPRDFLAIPIWYALLYFFFVCVGRWVSQGLKTRSPIVRTSSIVTGTSFHDGGTYTKQKKIDTIRLRFFSLFFSSRLLFLFSFFRPNFTEETPEQGQSKDGRV